MAHDVLKLTNIARPVIGLQQCHRLGVERLETTLLLPGVLGQQMFGDLADVAAPLA